MSSLAMVPGMDLPSLPENHRIQVLVQARLAKPPEPQLVYEDAPHAYWPAEFYGLERVSVYRAAPVAAQHAVLETCGRALLEEAYFIEKAGISFAAEMVLLGQSIEERMLYGCFAAEETRHFDAVRAFLLGEHPVRPQGAFLALLSEVIACADRPTLQFVIQIVLEGWGLHHYRALREGCQEPNLALIFEGILRDEAAHHGSGRVLFSGCKVGEESLRRIEDIIAAMLQMVQLGPQAVLTALDRALGGMGRNLRIKALEELSGAQQAASRLDHLRQLMRFEQVLPVVERLEARGLFSPLAPEDCV